MSLNKFSSARPFSRIQDNSIRLQSEHPEILTDIIDARPGPIPRIWKSTKLISASKSVNILSSNKEMTFIYSQPNIRCVQ